MKKKAFELIVLRQHWINDDGAEDKNDLCSHGEVFIRIGDEVLSDESAGSWTLSVAGLFLLRSLSKNCELQDNTNHLIPCCGHSFYPTNSGDVLVDVFGCDDGIDWKVKHIKNEVELETEGGTRIQLPFLRYKETVLYFVNEVEKFYGDPKNKTKPCDSFEAKGFSLFWSEWMELKARWL